VGVDSKSSRAIWKAAILMHRAHGADAAKEASARALARHRLGDAAGFDFWSWICAAIRILERVHRAGTED
jgi:hypothetical protein